MKNIPRYLVLIAAIVSLANFLPYFYGIVASQRVNNMNYMFSPVIEDFVYTVSNKSLKVRFFDVNGNEYNQKEYAHLLPFIYTRDLQKWGEFPDTVGGVPVTPEEALRQQDSIMIRPAYIENDKLMPQLFPLFEAESEFMGVQMPGELFRIAERMEFINAEHNKINEEKSALFTAALADAGFTFPAKIIAGNADARKSYDFGYFVLDSADVLFHIYQVKERPVVRKTGVNPESGIRHMLIRENINLPYYGFLVANNGDIYEIMKKGYKLTQIPHGSYEPGKESFTLRRNMLYNNVRIIAEDEQRIYVSDHSGRQVAEYVSINEKRIRGIYKTVYDVIFPFGISFDSNTAGRYPVFGLSEALPAALGLSFVLAAITFFWQKRRGALNIVDVAFVLISGIYGFISLILLGALDARD